MKPRTRVLTLAILIALAPLVSASEGPPTEPGLPRACERSGNANPCRTIIYETIVDPGENITYTGNYTAVGKVTILAGGTANIVDANISFESSSGGFIAEPGGTLRIVRSSLFETNASAYAIRAVGGNFTLNDSRVVGGDGVSLESANVAISGSTLADAAVALRLAGITTNVHHNQFLNNTVAANLTGGVPTLSNNLFQGGEVCVQDWRTDPNILNNVFRDCHIGIYHRESHSLLSGNDFRDQAEPPGAGIWVIDGNSPLIENNIIRDFGTGIRVTNARAFVRNNTIEASVGDGILIEGNSAPMDVQGNVVRDSGADGIRLVGAVDVPVHGNTVEQSAGAGIRLVSTVGSPVTGNTVQSNAGQGIVVEDTAFAQLAGNVVTDNVGDGIALLASPDAALSGNSVAGNARGILIDAQSPRAALSADHVSGNDGDGILVQADAVTIDNGTAGGNGGHGLALDHALDADVYGLEANDNGGDGVRITGSRAKLQRVNASENSGHGFAYIPMGPSELLATELTFVRAINNTGAGLRNFDGNATTVRGAWWEANDLAGVYNDDLVAPIDARECYWGSPSGPTHALNPLGTGDRVEGAVFYTPFLTAPPPAG